MRILLISAAFPPARAGEAEHSLHLCQHLADAGMDVHVLTTRNKALNNGFSFKVYPYMRNWSWFDLPSLAMFLRRCSPDAVILMYTGWIYNDHPMITFAATISKALLPTVPFVTQFGIVDASFRPSIFARAVRKGVKLWADQKNIDFYFGSLLRDSDKMIFLSERHLAEVAEKFPNVKGKSVVIPPPPLMRISPKANGATRKRARESLDIKPDDFLIAYFGYVDENKGLETLFKALQMVANRRKNVQLMMLGGGLGPSNDAPSQCSKTRVPFEQAMEALNDLRQRSERVVQYERAIYAFPNELGIADKVIWKGGYASDSDEASVYLRAADACVLPFDGGVTLNRSSFAAAAAHGLPIVTTQGPLLESAFVHQKNLFLCPPKNPGALAVAIETLMTDPALRGRLSSGARDLAQKWFSWESAIKETLGTFKA